MRINESRTLERALRRHARRANPEDRQKIEAVLDDPDALAALEGHVEADARDTGHPIIDAIAKLLSDPAALLALIAAIAKIFGL